MFLRQRTRERPGRFLSISEVTLTKLRLQGPFGCHKFLGNVSKGVRSRQRIAIGTEFRIKAEFS